MLCAELVAAGVVKVVEVVVEPDRVPALVVQFTPAEFLSFATTAVIVVVSVPSTVFAAAVTVTLIGWVLAPQPAINEIAKMPSNAKTHLFTDTRASHANKTFSFFWSLRREDNEIKNYRQ